MKTASKWRCGRIIGVAAMFLMGAGLVLVVTWFWQDLAAALMAACQWASDPEAVSRTISAFGRAAPLFFMAFQVMQVLVAPIPGELSGIVGGYLFGAFHGFCYSSIALAIGSWLSFLISRYFSDRFVRKWIPVKKLTRFDHLLRRQGTVALLILFILPGFPKDYLCIIFGMGKFPLKAFMLISALGRMPGTLMLSFQGEFLVEQNYGMFAAMLAVTALAAVISIRYRESLYRWMEKINTKTGGGDG